MAPVTSSQDRRRRSFLFTDQKDSSDGLWLPRGGHGQTWIKGGGPVAFAAAAIRRTARASDDSRPPFSSARVVGDLDRERNPGHFPLVQREGSVVVGPAAEDQERSGRARFLIQDHLVLELGMEFASPVVEQLAIDHLG